MTRYRKQQSGIALMVGLVVLLLLTIIMIVPSPLRLEVWPTAFQYDLSEFAYFYVFLAAATLAYSWRTLFAFGAWTSMLWLGALALVALFGRELPELSAQAAAAGDAALQSPRSGREPPSPGPTPPRGSCGGTGGRWRARRRCWPPDRWQRPPDGSRSRRDSMRVEETREGIRPRTYGRPQP